MTDEQAEFVVWMCQPYLHPAGFPRNVIVERYLPLSHCLIGDDLVMHPDMYLRVKEAVSHLEARRPVLVH